MTVLTDEELRDHYHFNAEGHVLPKVAYCVVAKDRQPPTLEQPKPRLRTWVMTVRTKAEAIAKVELLLSWGYPLEDVAVMQSPLDWSRVEGVGIPDKRKKPAAKGK